MNKALVIISVIFLTFACSSTYKIKPYKEKTPDWYIVDKDEWRTLYGKALGESESLEMASRKAEALAVSNIPVFSKTLSILSFGRVETFLLPSILK